MSVLEVIVWIGSIAAGTGLAGTLIGLLAGQLKKSKLVRNLHLENLIDTLAKTAVNFTEAWAKSSGKKGTAKLNIARDAFQEELANKGIKLDVGSIDRRLEAVLEHIKGSIRKSEEGKEFKVD